MLPEEYCAVNKNIREKNCRRFGDRKAKLTLLNFLLSPYIFFTFIRQIFKFKNSKQGIKEQLY